MILVNAPTIEVEGAYQFNKEDVEKAIKGLETYLSVTHAITTLGGLSPGDVKAVATTVGGILLPSVDDATDGAAEAAVKGLKKLVEKFEKVKGVGLMKVIYPREVFRFNCEQTKECVDGDWVVTKRTFTFRDANVPGTPPVATYDAEAHRPGSGSAVLPAERLLVLEQARTWAIQQNAPEYAKVEACRKLCE